LFSSSYCTVSVFLRAIVFSFVVLGKEIKKPEPIPAGAGVELFSVSHCRAILGCRIDSTRFRECHVKRVAFDVNVLLSNTEQAFEHHLRITDARRLKGGFDGVDQALDGFGLDSHFCVSLFGVNCLTP